MKQSAIPLLGATVIAILAFAAIGTSDDSTGEFCRSLYQVVLVSLGAQLGDGGHGDAAARA